MQKITVNEMETMISTMKTKKTILNESLEKWGEAIQENLHNKAPLLQFMEGCITHVTTCQQFVTENNLETDDETYQNLLHFLDTEGADQSQTVGRYTNLMKQIDQMAEDETEPEEKLGKLVHFMEMYYFNTVSATFYEFLLAYNKGLLALYRYIRKVEELRSA